MKKHSFKIGDKDFTVYVKGLSHTNGIIVIPQLKWLYLFRYDINTQAEYESERDEMVRSLMWGTKMDYGDAEELIDRINESF
ncbi:hypothetical protein PDR89_15320 [Bacillus cereus group sp. Bc002]|uniref:hypothetical protein n=1 Tax=Bacillus cereus group sp. Bc002 TaxID=3018130 RepID=UPI0022DF8679|nr:hypothetical protein [Bacillus cereus group sp. Bc002]MDA2780809.1 hypothetical protein [Bacillus cereus group sp. Bc002]